MTDLENIDVQQGFRLIILAIMGVSVVYALVPQHFTFILITSLVIGAAYALWEMDVFNKLQNGSQEYEPARDSRRDP